MADNEHLSIDAEECEKLLSTDGDTPYEKRYPWSWIGTFGVVVVIAILEAAIILLRWGEPTELSRKVSPTSNLTPQGKAIICFLLSCSIRLHPSIPARRQPEGEESFPCSFLINARFGPTFSSST